MQRSLRNCEAEKTDAQDRLSELTASNTSLQSNKRKLDQQLATLREEFEDLEGESKENSEKLHRAVEQSNRYQSELMSQRDTLSQVEKSKVYILNGACARVAVHILIFFSFQSTLEQQVKELNNRLDEEVASAKKIASRETSKLQQRVSIQHIISQSVFVDSTWYHCCCHL